MDPDRVDVATMQRLFGRWLCSKWTARLILATGVRQGAFIDNGDGSVRLVREVA